VAFGFLRAPIERGQARPKIQRFDGLATIHVARLQRACKALHKRLGANRMAWDQPRSRRAINEIRPSSQIEPPAKHSGA
jgi:hypothetical protein